MKEGQYFLPGEFAVYLAFVLLPGAIIALGFQVRHLHQKGLLQSCPGKAVAALVGTVLLGSVAGIAILILAPNGYGRLLGIREVTAFGQAWPVWPLGFLTLGASAVFTSSWLGRGNKSAA
jgi:hypothetical protein